MSVDASLSLTHSLTLSPPSLPLSFSLLPPLPLTPLPLSPSPFGLAFARAAERLGVACRQDMFESSFLEIESEHVDAFFRVLQQVMDEEEAEQDREAGEGPSRPSMAAGAGASAGAGGVDGRDEVPSASDPLDL